MKTFKYTARNVAGKNVAGSVQAESQADAVGELRKKQLNVVKLTPVSEGRARKKAGGFLSFASSKRPNVKKDELPLVAFYVSIWRDESFFHVSATDPFCTWRHTNLVACAIVTDHSPHGVGTVVRVVAGLR